MRLILTEDVPNLGSLGDTVEVKDGYGRNYLIPQGKALQAGNRASKELQHRLHHLQKLREGKIALAHEQAAKIKDLQLEVVRKAGPGGRLFGSVTNRDLMNLLNEHGYEFDRRALVLLSPIRNVGSHEFSVRVHTEVKAALTVKVIGEFDKKASDEQVTSATEEGSTDQEAPESEAAGDSESSEKEPTAETEEVQTDNAEESVLPDTA